MLQQGEGAQSVVAKLGVGDYFGEMAVLSDGSRNATLRSRTGMDVLLVSKADFNLLKAGVPAFSQAR